MAMEAAPIEDCKRLSREFTSTTYCTNTTATVTDAVNKTGAVLTHGFISPVLFTYEFTLQEIAFHVLDNSCLPLGSAIAL
jgi:hypothetical protein